MPSLTSNKNKRSLLPYPPPEGSVCIPVTLPNDVRWISAFLGQIYTLSQQIWWDRDAAHTAKDIASVWRGIYLETVQKAWGCDGMFDIRIDPADECSIQKTIDGVTWVEAFRLDTGCGIRRLQINPFTGRLGYQLEDLSWYEVPDGPWEESLYPEFTSLPRPIDSVDPECVAAVTAAYVLRNLYDQTGNELLNYVANTDWEYAGALGSMLTGFLMTIGMVASQPYVAVATLLGIVGVRHQYVDYPLDGDDEGDLMCLLLEHSTLHSNGSVTFDFQAVWDGIALASPKNGLLRFLLTMIGPDALNYSGAIDAGLSADCSSCDDVTTYCFTWDFAAAQDKGGWELFFSSCAQAAWNAYGQYSWSSLLFCGTGVPVTRIRPLLALGDANTTFTRIEARVIGQGAMVGLSLENVGATIPSGGPTWVGADINQAGPWQPTIGAATSGAWGDLYIEAIRVYYTAPSSHWTPNC